MSDDDGTAGMLAGSSDDSDSSNLLVFEADDSKVDMTTGWSRRTWLSWGDQRWRNSFTPSSGSLSSIADYCGNALLMALVISMVGTVTIVWLALRVNQLSQASVPISKQNQTSLQVHEQNEVGKSKASFIETVLGHPVEGPFDPAPIRAKCDSTTFRPGLVWHCAHITTGVTNAKNELLDCVRYALEAGATTLVVPGIQLRHDDLKNLGWHDPIDMAYPISYLFDAHHLVSSWKEACPQMTVILWRRYIADKLPGQMPVVLVPDQIFDFERRYELIVNSTLWREHFDRLMAANPAFRHMTAENPVRVYQVTGLLNWNRESDDAAFVRQFSRILAFPMQTRRLAAAALWKLGLEMGKPAVLLPPHLDSEAARLVKPGFVGVHLRLEPDVGDIWGGYEAQRDLVLDQARRLDSCHIFVGTGSIEHQDRLRKDVSTLTQGRTIHVYSKRDLLSPEELNELYTLTFDQHALVDFDILMRAEFLTGVNPSTFSWWLALRRNLLPEAGPMVYTDPNEMGNTGYQDNITKLLACHGKIGFDSRGIWP